MYVILLSMSSIQYLSIDVTYLSWKFYALKYHTFLCHINMEPIQKSWPKCQACISFHATK